MSGNPKIDPLFLPTAKPHPLNTLTCGPPPMYWLGTSRWCLGPLCMLHSIWIVFFLALTPFSAASVFVWFYYTFWLVFISYGVKNVWASKLIFLAFHPFFRLGVAWVKALIFLPNPYFFFLCQWASWLLILPHHFIVPAIALPSLLLHITPWTCGLTFLPCQPTLSIFYSGLPRSTFCIFAFLRLC